MGVRAVCRMGDIGEGNSRLLMMFEYLRFLLNVRSYSMVILLENSFVYTARSSKLCRLSKEFYFCRTVLFLGSVSRLDFSVAI